MLNLRFSPLCATWTTEGVKLLNPEPGGTINRTTQTHSPANTRPNKQPQVSRSAPISSATRPPYLPLHSSHALLYPCKMYYSCTSLLGDQALITLTRAFLYLLLLTHDALLRRLGQAVLFVRERFCILGIELDE